MGGWYLQPDCNMPCGEALVRQIEEGRKYFKEKFGVVPTVAMNVDSFGHSRGLVQIMNKLGYEGYMIVRPQDNLLDLPANEFRWVGYDGSEITTIRIAEGYNSFKGRATEKIQRFINNCPDGDSCICMWGIGNHGGGPSKADLDKIDALTQSCKSESVELIQSTPERYFSEQHSDNSGLPKFAGSLVPSMPGCYTSQVRLKQKYRAAENLYFMTEMMSSHAAIAGTMKYPAEELTQAMYDILLVQFHDMLPGTSIQPAEEMGLRVLDHGMEILTRVKARAFYALSGGQKPPKEDRIPIFAYNPYPYPITGDFSCEFMLWDQNWDDPFLECVVYDENNTLLPSQSEKEYSNIPIQWRKRATFHGRLAPMSMSRFDCAFVKKDALPVYTMPIDGVHYVFDSGKVRIKINRQTGLIDEYSCGGINYVTPGAFALEVYEDNYDPWYMEEKYNSTWQNKIGSFKLADKEETQKFCHLDAPIEPVHIIEDGAVRTVAEAVFTYNSARAVVKYIMSQNEPLKVSVRIIWDEKQKMVKMNIPAAFGAKECIGQQPYGCEVLKDDMTENVSQEYIVFASEDKAMLAVNNGTYGSSFDRNNGMLKLTLLRSPAYCTHPLPNLNPVPQDRYISYIDQGERDFEFMFDIGSKEEMLNKAGRTAQHFNMRPMLLSFYPDTAAAKPEAPIIVADNDIVNVTAVKRSDNGSGYVIRLFNPTEEKQTALVRVCNDSMRVELNKYEIKTVCYENGIMANGDIG